MKGLLFAVLVVSVSLSGSALASVSCGSTDRLGIMSCVRGVGNVLATYLWSDHRTPTQDEMPPIATYLWSD